MFVVVSECIARCQVTVRAAPYQKRKGVRFVVGDVNLQNVPRHQQRAWKGEEGERRGYISPTLFFHYSSTVRPVTHVYTYLGRSCRWARPRCPSRDTPIEGGRSGRGWSRGWGGGCLGKKPLATAKNHCWGWWEGTMKKEEDRRRQKRE